MGNCILMFVLNLALKACGNIAYGFNHRDYNHDDCVLNGRSILVFLSLLLNNNSVSSRRMGWVIYLWLKPQAILLNPSGIDRELI
jgi:hypothetical protein